MLQRNSDYNRIKFLEQTKETPIEKKAEKEVKKLDTSNLLPKKMDNAKAIDTRGDKFLSAGMGTIKDTGGPRKYMGSMTCNSIWDSEVLKKLSEIPDNKEKTHKEVEDIRKMKKQMATDRLNEIASGLKETDVRKESNVAKISDFEKPSLYKRPANSISIFDTLEGKKDFERVPEKTAGEEMVERVKASKIKDESWKPKNNISTSQIVNDMFDKILEEKNDK